MTVRPAKPVQPLDQLNAGKAFFSGLGLEVNHFGAIWHIFKVGQLMATDLNRISGQHGLSIADFHLLGALMMSDPEPLRATDLAHALTVSNAALSGRIAKLAKAGLITCATYAADRRARMLRPTPSGIGKVHAIGRALEEDGRFITHYRRLSASDQAVLDRIMGDLHAWFDRDFVPVPRGIG